METPADISETTGNDADGRADRPDPLPRPAGEEALRARIAELEETVRERDRRLEQRERALARVRGHLAEREKVLAEVLSSRSWRSIQQLQAVRQRLLPRGSRRARLLGAGARAAKSLARRLASATTTLRAAVVLGARQIGRRRSARWLSIDPVQPVPLLATHTAPVDVVVCVHDAMTDVQACLESLVRSTLPPYRLILVDDGSGEETRGYLTGFAAAQGATLIRNQAARGYTVAANQGLARVEGDYAVLLNSDTITTPGWLDRLVACAESDPRIGIVGPLSNTASWQSVPEVLDAAGDWAANPLPEGFLPGDMAELVAQASPGVYPRLPFLNGFCLLIRSELLGQIGLLDEATFPQGYGEENDLCLRAARAGWALAVAGDAYVFHAQSRSYTHERRRQIVQVSDAALVAKHGERAVGEGVEACRTDRVLVGIRARARAAPVRQRLVESGRRRWEGRRVLFVLPLSEPGGGGHVVIQEAAAMLRMGVDVRFLNLLSQRAEFEAAFPGIEVPIVYADGVSAVALAVSGFDAIIATAHHTVEWLESDSEEPQAVRAYYVQDYEPSFFAEGSELHGAARRSYTRFPDLVRFTKTEWNRDAVRESIGVDCTVVGPSVDFDLFRPRPRRSDSGSRRPLRIAAMIRPSTPRRCPELTMRVLRELVAIRGHEVEVVLFGCDPSDPEFRRLDTDFAWRHAGVLTRPRLASLLNGIDVFADLSSFQAMGLTAMEAMACGAAVIVPACGGATSFARDEENALVVDTGQETECVRALDRLVTDEALRTRLQRQAIEDACDHPPELAAFRILETLFPVGERS